MSSRYASLAYALASSIALTPSYVAAQQTAAVEDGDTMLEEIIVTARKQDESLVDTPIAVSVLTSQFFDDSGINTITDMVRFVPGFDYSPTNTTRAQGSKIRGISTFSFSDGFESSVATVIDGVVMGREAQGFFDLYDIESVEVIKGPQGTLFGKNASAGVVNVRTKNPEFEFSGGGDIMYGSYDELRIRGSITGPLVEDVLAFRVTGSSHKSDGLLENKLEGEDDVNDKDTWALRSKMLYTPTENFSALLTLDIVKEDNACCLATYRNAGDPSILFALALNPDVLQLQDALNQLGIEAGPENRAVAVDYDRISQVSESKGAALKLNYDFGGAQLTSITSIRDWEIDEFNEADQLSISNVNNRNGTISDTKQFSQELRLSGALGESFSYVAGLYYFEEDLYADGAVFVEIALPFPPFFNVVTHAERTVDSQSTALFGEFTWDLTEKFSLIAGGRYTDEEKEAWYSRSTEAINPALPFLGNFGPDFSGTQKVSDTNFSGRIIGRYSLSENVNAYLTWSKGYKGIGIDVAESSNLGAIAEPGGLPVLAPEIPTLWELGFKGWFFDNTFSVNTAIFHQSIEGLQAITSDSIGQILNLSIDEVVSKGIEMDLTYLPHFIEGLTLTGSVTLLNVKYAEFAERPDLEGEDYRDVPKWALSMIGDYRFPLGDNDWEGFVRAEYYWQDDKNTSLSAAEGNSIEAYSLLNLRAGVTSPDERYSLTFSVENATGTDYPYWIGGSSYSAVDGVTTSQYLGPDRQFRVTLGAKF